MRLAATTPRESRCAARSPPSCPACNYRCGPAPSHRSNASGRTTDEPHSQRGSASVELVLVTPLLVAMLLFVVGVGRLAAANGEVDAAARDAARAAANERSTSAATQAGAAAAAATLEAGGVTCRQLDIAIDTTSFRADGIVGATVTCVVDLEAVAGIGFPAAPTLEGSFTSPIDRYRGVAP